MELHTTVYHIRKRETLDTKGLHLQMRQHRVKMRKILRLSRKLEIYFNLGPKVPDHCKTLKTFLIEISMIDTPH